MSWQILFPRPGEGHVVPEDDLVSHGGPGCPCAPRLDLIAQKSGGTARLYVHHSLDGRELSEPDYQGA